MLEPSSIRADLPAALTTHATAPTSILGAATQRDRGTAPLLLCSGARLIRMNRRSSTLAVVVVVARVRAQYDGIALHAGTTTTRWRSSIKS